MIPLRPPTLGAYAFRITDGCGTSDFEILYGYHRTCGRVVLVTERLDDKNPYGRMTSDPSRNHPTLWELVSATEATGSSPQPVLHERMLATPPGATVTYRRKIVKLTLPELAVYDRTVITMLSGPPPHIRARFPGGTSIPVHDCKACYWV